jgi:hypothetical protein
VLCAAKALPEIVELAVLDTVDHGGDLGSIELKDRPAGNLGVPDSDDVSDHGERDAALLRLAPAGLPPDCGVEGLLWQVIRSPSGARWSLIWYRLPA